MRILRDILVGLGLFAFAVLLALGAVVALTQAGLGAEPPRQDPGPPISLAPGWEGAMLRFATRDDAERRIVRHLHVNPEALARARPGEPLPHGTVLVMADARAAVDAAGALRRGPGGRLVPEPGWIAISAQWKLPGGGAAHPPGLRNGEWEYALFDGEGRRRDVPVTGCLACHAAARAAQDYVFDAWDLVQARR